MDGQMTIFDFLKEPEPEHVPPVHRYLRYGPHTLIDESREETKLWLQKNGVPSFVTWDKNSLPCENCTWYDGSTCRGGAHTTHYEFGYLICDRFYQSITERKPSTVGDTFPSMILPVEIKGLCEDAYCPKCGRALDEYRYCDQDCPTCHAKLDWTPWHRANDDWWLSRER